MLKTIFLVFVASVSSQATPDLSKCDVWNDGCNNCRVNNGKIGECQKYVCKEKVTPYCKQKKSDMGERVDKMFDGKNKNGGLIDDIILERQNSGNVTVQTGFNTDENLDSQFMGARLKFLEFFKFAMVRGNLK